ncbi:hypothetical protein [Kineococcus esterisolvens]
MDAMTKQGRLARLLLQVQLLAAGTVILLLTPRDDMDGGRW